MSGLGFLHEKIGKTPFQTTLILEFISGAIHRR